MEDTVKINLLIISHFIYVYDVYVPAESEDGAGFPGCRWSYETPGVVPGTEPCSVREARASDCRGICTAP